MSLNTAHELHEAARGPAMRPGRRRRILLSTYACAPGEGSEPGVGWNLVHALAQRHDVWAVVRADHRPAIAAELASRPLPSATFLYHRIPFERGDAWYSDLGVQFHYYLWQFTAHRLMARLHRDIGFDVVHHLTYARYWTPSAAAFLGAPFVFGPVGGADSAPPGFLSEFGPRGRLYERIRDAVRWIAGHDPFLRSTLRRARIVLATTPQTRNAVHRLGATDVRLCSDIGMSDAELELLGSFPPAGGGLRLLTTCRLIHWKGIHLALRAFAAAGIPDAEYWILGDGPARRSLEALAGELGIGNQVIFFGNRPRTEALERLAQCHALVHPSLHETGGWSCIEAMAARRAILCLDWGGPGMNVPDDAGWRIAPGAPEQVVRHLAAAMKRLAADPVLAMRMGEAGRRHVCTRFQWQDRALAFERLYDEVLEGKA